LIHLYCATGNPGKLREFRLAAGTAPVAIDLLPGFADIPPCVEDGATFEENAIIKARHYARFASSGPVGRAGVPAAPVGPPAFLFADDSGLEVDALGGAPGVISARYCGHHGDDLANNRLLIENLRGVRNRAARFVCAIALVEGTDLRGVYRGAVEGVIVDQPRGAGGFGYDPHFFYPPFGCTFGEVDAQRKFSVSHRGQALRAMLAELLAQHAPA
jgi:XTP/dITP diphosphohydrolase